MPAVLPALVVASVLSLASTPATPPVARTTITGRVLAPTGMPLPQATVRVIATRFTRSSRATSSPVVVSTDEAGRFSATSPEGTAFLVHIEAPGLAPFTKHDITAGASLEVGMSAGQTLTGRVVDALNGAPVPGARVLGCDQAAVVFGDASCAQALSGELGLFRLENLPAGALTVEAVATGRAWSPAVSLDLSSAAAPTEPLRLALSPGGAIRGRVVDSKGRPLGDVRIRLQPADATVAPAAGPRDRPTWSAEDGSFVVAGLPAAVRFEISAARGQSASAKIGPLTVAAGEMIEGLTIELRIPARLTLRLLDASGRPADATVSGSLVRGDEAPRWIDAGSVTSCGDAAYSIDGLDAGTFALRLEPQGFLPIQRTGVELRTDQITDLGDLTVDPGEAIRGRVVESAGTPIEGARIEGTTLDGRFPRRVRSTSRRDGSFELSGLAADAVVTVHVEAEGHASTEPVELRVADARPVELVLHSWGRIRGRVVDENGDPVSRFRIRPVIEADDDLWRSVMRPDRLASRAFEDPDGLFVYEDVPPGTYTILASVEAKPDARRTGLAVAEGATVEAGRIVVGPGIELSGRVVDPSGAAVPGARVEVVDSGLHRVLGAPDRATATDADGGFVIPGLVAGRLRLRAEQVDFAPVFADVELEPNRMADEVVLRLAVGGRVVGTVRDRERRPVVGARIGASPADDLFGADEIRASTTDVEGRYEIARLTPGGYRVIRMDRASRDPLDLEMHPAAIADGETVVVDFDESARVRLSGRVLRGTGPLSGASLIFVPVGSAMEALDGFRSARADAAGHYEIDLDQSGAYRVFVGSEAQGPIGGGAVVEIVVPSGPSPTTDIVLRGGGVAGTVHDEEGRPLAGASVLAQANGGSPDRLAGPRGAATTDGSGRYRVEGLEAGSYDMSVSVPALEPGVRRGVVVGPDAVTDGIDFRLGRGELVRGRVVDVAARGIAGATVLAVPNDSDVPLGGNPGLTDINGAFRVVAPPETPIDLVVIASGYAPLRASNVVASGDPDSAPILLVATAGGRLAAQVVDADGIPLQGARLMLRATPPWPVQHWLDLLRPPPPTDAEGFARIDGLAPGTYRVEASAPGQTIAPALAEVSEGAQTTLVLRATGPN